MLRHCVWYLGLLLLAYACSRDNPIESKMIESVKVQLSFDMHQDMVLIEPTSYMPYLASFQNHNALRLLARKGHLVCHIVFGWKCDQQRRSGNLLLPLYWKDDMYNLMAGHFIAETYSLIQEGRYKIYHTSIYDTSDPDSYDLLYTSDEELSAYWHRLRNMRKVVVLIPMRFAGSTPGVSESFSLLALRPFWNL